MSEQTNQKKQFWIILTIVFLGFLGISIPYLIFPALFLNPNYLIVPSHWSDASRAIFLGITLASYPLGQFIGSPILGSLSDDYGRKNLISGSLLISAVCNLFTGFAIQWQNLEILILSRFFAGLMEGNIAIARAMAADLTTISKHKTFGKINAAASIAFLVGPLLGGLLTDKDLYEGFTISTPFHYICILFFCVAGLSAVILKDTLNTNKVNTRTFWQRINLYQRLRALCVNKRLQFLMITSTCFTLAVDIFYEFGPVYLTIKWSLEPSQLVFYNAILCLTLAIGNGWLPSLASEYFSNRLTILYSMAFFPLLVIGMILTDSPAIMLTLFGISGLIIGLVVTLLTVKISNSVEDDIQGEVMGTQISLRVLGDAVICLFGGALLLASAKLILVVSVIIAVFTIFYYGLKA